QPAVPDDRRALAGAAAAGIDDRGAGTVPGPVRGERGTRLEPAPGAASAATRRAATEPTATAPGTGRRGRVADRAERRHHPADVGDARVREDATAASRVGPGR